MSKRLASLALLSFALSGCGSLGTFDGGPGGSSDVSGTVGGKSFTVASGSAEVNDDGTYVVTLADTPEFSCNSSSGLPGNFLQLVISNVSESGQTYDAKGNVFFNVFKDGVSEGKSADQGTVTIDTVDAFGGSIDGSVDASNADSSVSGSFSADICR